MPEKINWQDHNPKAKPSLFLYIMDWFGHSLKIIFWLMGVLACFYYLILPQIKVNYFYKSTPCMIVSKKMQLLSKSTSNPGVQPQFLVMYNIDKKIYTNWTFDSINTIYTNPAASQLINKQIKLGNFYTCWYDSKNPHKVVITRGWDYMSMIFFLLTLIVFIASLTSTYRWHQQSRQTK